MLKEEIEDTVTVVDDTAEDVLARGTSEGNLMRLGRGGPDTPAVAGAAIGDDTPEDELGIEAKGYDFKRDDIGGPDHTNVGKVEAPAEVALADEFDGIVSK